LWNFVKIFAVANFRRYNDKKYITSLDG